MNKRQINNAPNNAPNNIRVQNVNGGQGSRNNPLNYINGQQPQTYNQLAVGSKALISAQNFDNNSLDRMQQNDTFDLRAGGGDAGLSMGQKQLRQQNQQQQMATAYTEQMQVMQNNKGFGASSASKQNKRTSSMKNDS